jgi:predicted RNA-binding Zn-ribbon protein involved in translation (DUF1610 family)
METALAIIASLYWAATWSTLGHALLRNCGRGTDGIKLGLFLGPLGCAIAFSLSRAATVASTPKAKRSHFTCVHCGGFIDNVAGMTGRFDCPYCGKTISLLVP